MDEMGSVLELGFVGFGVVKRVWEGKIARKRFFYHCWRLLLFRLLLLLPFFCWLFPLFLGLYAVSA